MGYEIRAMSFAEIMDTGFRIVRQHFGLIIGIAAALYVPIAILGALVAPEPVPGSGPCAGVDAWRGGFLIRLVLYADVLSPKVAAAITFAIGEIYVGRSAPAGHSLGGRIGEGVARAAGVASTSAVAVVLYFDVRCRKEAFDLEHLARLVAGPEGSAEVV